MPGPTISIPIIDFLAHPNLGRLSRSLPFTLGPGGMGSLNPPQPPLNVPTYGLQWSIFTIPAGYGKTAQNPDVYEDPFLQLSSVYTTLSGNDITVQTEQEQIDGSQYFWNEPLPTRLLYWIAPGVTITFFWLQT